jgi:hypothetical protein
MTSDNPTGGAPAAPASNPFSGEAGPSAAQVQGSESVAQLRSDPSFMKGLTAHDPRARQPYLDRWEKAHMQQSGTPQAPAAFAERPPSEIDGDGAKLDYMVGPKSAHEYVFSLPEGATADPGLPQFRDQVFQAGVAPLVANQIWKALPQTEAMSEPDYQAAVRAAATAVRGQEGGDATVRAAHAYGSKLMQQGRLWERAVLAAYTTPSGILELGRLARRASRNS